MAAAYPLDASRTAWISKGFEHLAAEVLGNSSGVHFDVLIVGSGYGGAIAAATLAGRKDALNNTIRVGVLERTVSKRPTGRSTSRGCAACEPVQRDEHERSVQLWRHGAAVLRPLHLRTDETMHKPPRRTMGSTRAGRRRYRAGPRACTGSEQASSETLAQRKHRGRRLFDLPLGSRISL
jgi:choline dehydrogenase-like flavoprotein